MSVSGLCQVCESAQANHRCDRCGTLVCDEHFDTGMDLCVNCAQDARGGGTEDTAPQDPGDVAEDTPDHEDTGPTDPR